MLKKSYMGINYFQSINQTFNPKKRKTFYLHTHLYSFICMFCTYFILLKVFMLLYKTRKCTHRVYILYLYTKYIKLMPGLWYMLGIIYQTIKNIRSKAIQIQFNLSDCVKLTQIYIYIICDSRH